MTTISRPQRCHLTAAQWQTLFDRFDAGDENVTAFCRRHGVCTSSFHRWRRKLAGTPAVPAETAADDNTSAFIEAGALTSEQTPAAAAWDVELALGNGIVLRLRRG